MQEAIEITPSDQNFIYEQLAPLGGLFGEEVTCQCPIYSTEDDKDQELLPSILVIGKYRVLLIKKEKNTRKVKKSIHLYDLIEISEPEINARFYGESNIIEIKYKDNSTSTKDNNSNNNNSVKSFLIKSPTKEIEIIIIKTLALTSFSISKGFPENYLLKIQLPKTRYPQLKFDHEIGIQDGKGIAEQYIAHSHYFNTKSTLDFLRHLETLYLTRYPELDFSEIPGIDPTCCLSFNLYTSIITLRHNNFIRSLKISSLPHVNITAAVGEMMLTNTAITELNLSNLLTEQSFVPIGNFLKLNPPYSSLQVLNLSNNLMNYESISSLCDGLAHFNHSLVTLNLSNCQIPSKGIALLFESFQKNFAMSLTLEVLVLSDNRFQDSGSKALASWLSKIKGENSLRKLILSNTQLNVSVISPPLRTLSLESLDLSRNSMNIQTARNLAIDALESIESLKYLNLSNCGLVGDSVQTILVSLAHNKKLKGLTINFQSNGFANKTYLALISVLPQCKEFLRGLDLSFNSFNSKQLQDIVNSLLGSNLESLDIGNNYIDEALSNKLIELVKENCIQKLGFGHQSKSLGSSLHELIAAIGTCKSIQVLDLMGNGLDDQGACILADCIRHNKTIQRIYISGNKFTSVGWQSISSPLLYYRNQSLVHIDLPLISDIILVSDSNPVPVTTMKREQLQMIFTKIRTQLSLNKNKVPSSSRFAYLPQNVDPPLYVKPVANVPEYLSQYVLSPVEQKLLEKVNLNSNNNTSNGSIKINLNVQASNGYNSIGSSSSGSSSIRPSLSSIFTKPINFIHDIKSGEISLGSGSNSNNNSANNSRLNSPVHFNEDNDWKGNRNDDDRQDLK